MITEIRNPFSTEFYQNAWQLWKDFKQEQFSFKYKPIGEQAALQELFYLSDGNEETAIGIINQSLTNGWKGLFEIKIKKHGQPKKLDADKCKDAILRKVAG